MFCVVCCLMWVWLLLFLVTMRSLLMAVVVVLVAVLLFVAAVVGFMLLVVGCDDVLVCCDADALRRGVGGSCVSLATHSFRFFLLKKREETRNAHDA